MASPRALRPFTGVLPIAALPQTFSAPDRGRIAFITAQGELAVLDAAGGTPRVVRRPQDGFSIDLDAHGLHGDRLVFIETRTQGQRTDARVLEMDLRGDSITTLDDFSGPFLGGGDTWRPRAPITNGEDVAWVRVDVEGAPFGVHVVLRMPVQGGPRVIHSGTSALWIDLAAAGPVDADARLLISTLIGEGQVAELILWQGGIGATPLGSRPSGEGGPAVFAGDHIFWARGPGIVRNITSGELIGPARDVKQIDLGCAFIGASSRHLLADCSDQSARRTSLIDPVSGERFELPGTDHRAGARAVVWAEGAQWWLGTIAQ